MPGGEEVENAWRDLTLTLNDPEPPKEAVPRVVRFREWHCDDVSALNEGSHLQMRFEEFDPTEEKMSEEIVEKRVDSMTDEESTEVEVERRFFAELYSTPLLSHRSLGSKGYLIDGDGSSYSTQRQHTRSLHTSSTDTTTQTKNTFNPKHFTNTQALI